MGHSSGDHLSEGHEAKKPQTCLKLSQAPSMIMLLSPSLQSFLPSSFLTFLPPLTPSWAAFLFPTLSSMAFLVQCDPRCAKAWPNHRQPCQVDHQGHNHYHQCDLIIANLSPLDNAWWEIWSLYGVEWDMLWCGLVQQGGRLVRCSLVCSTYYVLCTSCHQVYSMV